MTEIQSSFNEIEIRKDREYEGIRRFATGSLVGNVTGSTWVLGEDIDIIRGYNSMHFNVQPKASPHYLKPKEVKNKEFKEALGNHQEINFED